MNFSKVGNPCDNFKCTPKKYGFLNAVKESNFSQHSMTVYKYIFFISLSFTVSTSFAQQLSLEKLDTTISIFWNPNLKVRVQIIDPEEQSEQKSNTVLTLYSVDQGSKRILYSDSLYAYTLKFKIMDLNGDGIKDLLVYNTNNGPDNRCYHLYLVDQQQERLTRVKGFEKVFNPYYEQRRCGIIGGLFIKNKIIMHRFLINSKGTLVFTTWD